MSQSQRKGPSSASRASGKGARLKQNNVNVTAQIHGAGPAHGRAMPWNCTVCDNVMAEDDDSIVSCMQAVVPQTVHRLERG